MKVKLLRELLVAPSDVQATARDTVVDMEDARARDLASRPIPLVEIMDDKRSSPADVKADAAPVSGKKADETESKTGTVPVGKAKAK